MSKVRVILAIVLILGIFILAYWNHYSNSIIFPTTYLPETPNIDSQFSTINIDSENIYDGEVVLVSLNNIISLNLDSKDYFFRIKEIDTSQNKVYFENNGFLFYITSEPRKFDLNSDGDYDFYLSIEGISDGKAKISFNPFEKSATPNIDAGVENIVKKLERTYKIEMSIMFTVLSIVLILIAAYISFSFIIPSVKKKRALEREKPTEVLEYLVSEFDSAKRKDNKVEAKRIYTKAKNFYDYMSKKERAPFREKMKDMERYINKF